MSVEYASRAISEAERARADECRQTTGWRDLASSGCLACFLGGLTFSVLSAAIFLAEDRLPVRLNPLVWLVGSLFAAGLVAVVTLTTGVKDYRGRRSAAADSPILEDLQVGVVEVIRIEATELAVILEHEDEGRKYCYRVDQHKCLVLREMDIDVLEDYGAHADLARSRIEVVRLPKSALILRVAASGAELSPIAELDPHVDHGRIPSGEVFAADWADVVSGQVAL